MRVAREASASLMRVGALLAVGADLQNDRRHTMFLRQRPHHQPSHPVRVVAQSCQMNQSRNAAYTHARSVRSPHLR